MDGWLDEWDIFIPQMLVSCSHNPQSLGFHDSIARRLQGWGEGANGPLQLHVAGRHAQGMMRGNQRGVLWRLPCLGVGGLLPGIWTAQSMCMDAGDLR